METQKYKEFVSEYANMVFKIAYNYCRNKYDAEDIVQNTFLKLLQYKGEFADGEHAKRWLIRVTVNESKNMCTSFWHKRIVSLEESKSDAEFSFENDEESEIYDAVMKLGEKYRIVVHLYYYEEYSVKEIMSLLKLKDRANFLKTYLTPALEEGLISMKYPKNPKHPGQKYMLTEKGKALLK